MEESRCLSGPWLAVWPQEVHLASLNLPGSRKLLCFKENSPSGGYVLTWGQSCEWLRALVFAGFDGVCPFRSPCPEVRKETQAP